MVKFTNEIAKRCARWFLLETSPAPLPLLHPVRDDMAAAADEIERLQKLCTKQPQPSADTASERREAIAKRLHDKALKGLAYWEQLTEPNKDDWRAKADAWIAADLEEKRAHNRRYPLPVTFEPADTAKLSGLKEKLEAFSKAELIEELMGALVELTSPRAQPQSSDVTHAAQFLLDRLDEFDPGEDEPEREYHGHVAPAIARLRCALSRPQLGSTPSGADASAPDQSRNG